MKKESMSLKTRALKLAGRSLLAVFAAGMVSVAAGGFIAEACTSYYAGKAVTEDGSIIFGRTEDIGRAYDKNFVVVPAATHEDGEMYDDGTDFTMPLPAQTYRFTACMDDPAYGDGPFGETGTNEYGVSISATESASPAEALEAADPFTATGITETNMIHAVLPCVTTAREGIEFLADIIDTYGAGEGNTLMIGDKDECWYMEILTGHQYVAIKMPEDKAALMPNCFMLEYVDTADTENVIASEGLITTAETAGTLQLQEGSDTILHVRNSYTDGMGSGNTYRVWGGQIIFNESLKDTISPTDTDLPMFVTPDEKVTVKTMYEIAGSQYEGTDYEGQGRVIGSSASVECHIFQVRDDMPTELATIQWLCMGSADLSTFVPFYGAAITDTLPAYQVEDTNYNEASAYWTFRSLATLSGSTATNSNGQTIRSLAGVNVKAYWGKYMDDLITRQAAVDEKMMELYNTDPSAVSEKATNLGMAVADETITIAKSIYNELMTSLCMGDGVLYEEFIPSVAANETYSTYTYDSAYEAPVTITQDELDSVKKEAADAKAELANTKSELTTANTALANSNAQVEKLQKDLAAMQQTLSVAQNSIKDLEAQVAAATKENEDHASLNVAKKKLTVRIGKKATIVAATAPSSKIVYKSSNKKVASVNGKGVVKGRKAGTAKITVKANGISKTVKITVK